MVTEARHEEVERRAYELYERRGREDGHDWDDWLQAEREIRGQERDSDSEEVPASTARRRRAERLPEVAST